MKHVLHPHDISYEVLHGPECLDRPGLRALPLACSTNDASVFAREQLIGSFRHTPVRCTLPTRRSLAFIFHLLPLLSLSLSSGDRRMGRRRVVDNSDAVARTLAGNAASKVGLNKLQPTTKLLRACTHAGRHRHHRRVGSCVSPNPPASGTGSVGGGLPRVGARPSMSSPPPLSDFVIVFPSFFRIRPGPWVTARPTLRMGPSPPSQVMQLYRHRPAPWANPRYPIFFRGFARIALRRWMYMYVCT